MRSLEARVTPTGSSAACSSVQGLAGELGDLDRARAAAEEGERRARELEMEDFAVGFMNGRGQLEAARGNLAVAREVFREALALNAESADRADSAR